MAEPKTKPTRASAVRHIAQLPPARRADCEALVALMQRVTGHDPVMWGPSIVGFDRYEYPCGRNQTAEMCVIGFASRASDISVYLMGLEARHQPLFARLGKHRMGKACLSIKRLADVDVTVLEQLVAASYAATKQRFTAAPAT